MKNRLPVKTNAIRLNAAGDHQTFHRMGMIAGDPHRQVIGNLMGVLIGGKNRRPGLGVIGKSIRRAAPRDALAIGIDQGRVNTIDAGAGHQANDRPITSLIFWGILHLGVLIFPSRLIHCIVRYDRSQFNHGIAAP